MALPHRDKSMLKQLRTKLATWNIQGGIHSQYDAETISRDFEKYGVDIGVLQETKCGDFRYTSEQGTQVICLESDEDTHKARRYGQGFIISKKWSKHLWGIKRITDRISVAQFQLNKTGQKRCKMCVINVYGPTSLRQQEFPEEVDAYYDTLHHTVTQYSKSNYIVFMAGDLNAKLGLKKEYVSFIGTYGKGTWNASGDKFAEFLTEHNMYATNTSFCKAMRHRTTWSMPIKSKNIYNQIDYICVNRNIIEKHPHILIDSQSHDDMDFNSDHKMVITTIQLSAIYRQRVSLTKHTNKDPMQQPYDTTPLIHDSELQAKYNSLLQHKLQLQRTDSETNPRIQYEQITKAIQESLEELNLER